MTKVLMVLTSHDKLGDTGRSTGWYLPEAAHPWKVFARQGWALDFVSPKGGRNPMDGVDLDDPIQREFLEVFGDRGPDTVTADQVDANEYDVVFYVGGHGAMWDLPEDQPLSSKAAAIYENGGVVAAVCHGPAGLVNIKLSDDSYLVAGRELSAFTDAEEDAVGLSDVVPFLLASKLQERGAAHKPAPNFVAQVVADGRLITGQNPASATGVAEGVVSVLADRASV
jgi:putative intracellular protease/amidase